VSLRSAQRLTQAVCSRTAIKQWSSRENSLSPKSMARSRVLSWRSACIY